jgi:transposase
MNLLKKSRKGPPAYIDGQVQCYEKAAKEKDVELEEVKQQLNAKLLELSNC